MKIFLVFISFMVYCSSICAQNMDVRYRLCTTCNITNHSDTSQVFVYNAPQAFVSRDVTSDYGPRDLGSDHYDWHGGVDYSTEGGNNDIGNGLVAIDFGTINTLSIGGGGYKYITIDGNTHDFGYGHIFTSANPRSASGNYLKSGNFFIVLRDGTQANQAQASDYALITEDGRALYTTSTDTVTHPITGVRIATTNQIPNNNLTVGPLGNSIRVGRTVTAHLHLYLFENNNHAIGDATTKNPLQHVTHDQPSYDVDIFVPREVQHNHSHGNPPVFHNWNRFSPVLNGIEVEYPGDIETDILIRAQAQNAGNGNTYNNDVLNIERFSIKLSSQNSQVLQGPFYRSEIIYDGEEGNNTNRYLTNLTTRGEADLTTTGIECWAYSDMRQRPYDYYYFADFITRIHQNDPMDGNITSTMIANCPDDARYPDGRYHVYAEVEDIRNAIFQSDTLSFILDNWKPYLSEVSVTVGTTQIYNETWECRNDSLAFSQNNLATTITAAEVVQGFSVTATASEPLADLTLSIPYWNVVDLAGSPAADSLTFDFLVPYSNVTGLGTDFTLFFEGEDISGNELISFSPSSTAAVTVPSRDSNTSFVNPSNLSYGTDSIHGFYLGCTSLDTLKSGNSSSELRNSLSDTEVSITYENYLLSYETTNAYGAHCSGTGSIDITLTGGEPPFYVTWWEINGSDTIWISEAQGETGFDISLDLLGINEGDYLLQVADQGCAEIDYNFSVDYLEDTDVLTHTITHDCGAGGGIEVDSDILEGPFIIYWVKNGGALGPLTPTSLPAEITDLSEGTYDVYVYDATFCEFQIEEVIIAESSPIVHSVLYTVENPSTCYNTDGIIIPKKVPSGGTPPYTYLWSNGATTGSVYNLSGGLHTLTITDALGCQASKDFELDGQGQPYMTVPKLQDVCPGMSNGSIEVTGLSATGNLEVSWWDGQLDVGNPSSTSIQSKRENLSPGEYCYTVTDVSTGCMAEGCKTLEEIDDYVEMSLTSEIQHACDSQANGHIIVKLQGGEYPVEYEWSTGESSTSVWNLPSDVYSLTVTDHCENTLVSNFPVYTRQVDIQLDPEVICISDQTGAGSISLNATGANQPYHYSWSNFSYGDPQTFEEAGTYTVTITDTNGCQVTETVEMYEVEIDLEAEIRIFESTGCSATLDIDLLGVASGGTGPYQYNWRTASGGQVELNEGQELETSGLVGGEKPSHRIYTLTITDACGHTAQAYLDLSCDQICPDNCIVFYHEDRFNPPGCVDVCGDLVKLFDPECDQLEVRSICDDGVVRTIRWQTYNRPEGLTVFEGEDLIEGKDDRDIIMNGPPFLHGNIFVTNETTQCTYQKIVIMPQKRCWNLWKWLWDTFEGGGSIDFSSGGSASVCENWEIETVDCTTTKTCLDEGSNTIVIEFGETTKCVWATYYEPLNPQNPHEGDVKVTYTVVDLCQETCEPVGAGVSVSGLEPFAAPHSDCDDCQVTTIVSCDKNTRAILFDHSYQDFVAVSTSKGDSTELITEGFGISPLGKKKIYAVDYMDESIMIDIVQVNRLEYISVHDGSDGFLHLQYHNGIDSIAWTLSFADRIYESVIMHQGDIYFTYAEAARVNIKYISRFDRYGTVVSTEEIGSDIRIYSQNDDAQLHSRGQNYSFESSRVQNQFSLGSEYIIKGLFHFEGSRYGIVYNKDMSQASQPPAPGSSGGVPLVFSCGVLVYDTDSGQLTEHKLHKDRNALLVRYFVKDGRVACGIGIKDLVPNETYESFLASEELCTEYIVMDLSYYNQPTAGRSIAAGKTSDKIVDIAPNPTTGMVNVSVNSRAMTLTGVAVYDITGGLIEQRQLSGEPRTLSLELPKVNGIYILELRFQDGSTQIHQVVKI